MGRAEAEGFRARRQPEWIAGRTRVQPETGAWKSVTRQSIQSRVEMRRGGPGAPGLRFRIPLIEPDGRVSRIRLSDRLSSQGMRRATSPMQIQQSHDAPVPQALARG